jgi:hypothetical protein
MHRRIAAVLGWSVKETQGFSLQSLRELVRPLDPTLANEISESIRSGVYVRGPASVDMSWLGDPPK